MATSCPHAIESHSEAGVTLVELVAVMVIIAVLLSISIPAMMSPKVNARVGIGRQVMHTYQGAIEQFRLDNGGDAPLMGYSLPGRTAGSHDLEWPTNIYLIASGPLNEALAGNYWDYGVPYLCQRSIPVDTTNASNDGTCSVPLGSIPGGLAALANSTCAPACPESVADSTIVVRRGATPTSQPPNTIDSGFNGAQNATLVIYYWSDPTTPTDYILTLWSRTSSSDNWVAADAVCTLSKLTPNNPSVPASMQPLLGKTC
jgi:prepilin-type N-terminal cleavage/methylation domain-containing protein